jgi:hypothetical protein
MRPSYASSSIWETKGETERERGLHFRLGGIESSQGPGGNVIIARQCRLRSRRSLDWACR